MDVHLGLALFVAPAHAKEARMTAAPADEPNHSDPNVTADDAVNVSADDAMKDQLRKDVASWREARTDGSARQATELSVAVTRSIVPPTTAKMRRAAKPVAPEAKSVTNEKKPFGMSYDGTSRADYIKLMISRGAR
jgi:hypothetical protein